MRNVFMLNSIRIALLLVLVALYLAPAVAATVRGTTLVDSLQMSPGDTRTTPRFPRAGTFGIIVGGAVPGTAGRGVLCNKPGSAVIFPSRLLLNGTAGTIELSMLLDAPLTAATPISTLLETPVGDNGTIFLRLTLENTTLKLAMRNKAGRIVSIEADVKDWQVKNLHTVMILWDAKGVTLRVDGRNAAVDTVTIFPPREPGIIVFGNNEKLQSPAMVALCDLRISTEKDINGPVNIAGLSGEAPDHDVAISEMAKAYADRLYPALPYLRKLGIREADLAEAQSYADVEDLDKALQVVTPIAADNDHPMRVPAIFLRAEILSEQKDYVSAYDQLQALVDAKDINVKVLARVKQSEVRYAQGNTQEAMRLMSDLIAKYPDLSAINNVYLRIGIELFRTGNFDGAISALGVIGTIGAAPVTAIQIGAPLEIKVVDADMRTRAIDTPLQVTIISTSGDSVQALLKPAFSRGVYIGSIYTALGAPIKGDDILQVRGGDTAAITYIDRLSNDGVNIPRKVSVGFRTDSDLTVISQTAMATYIKIKEYQKLGLIDDKWRIIGELPIDAPAGFRNANGVLLGKGTEIRIADMKRIVPGQGVYIELSEPDAAETDGIDTIPGGRTARTIKVSTRKGKTANVTLTETTPLSGVFAGIVPTSLDANPPAGTLQVEENDTVSVNYLDPDPSKPENASHIGQVSLQKTNGQLAIFQSYTRKQKPDTILHAQAGRVPDEEKLTLQVNDRDLDMTDGRDTVTVKVAAPGGAELPVLLTETDVHTGIFTGQFQISTKALTAANGILPVKAGDIVTATYTDKQNSSDAPLDVLQTVRVNIAEDAVATLLEQHVELPAEGSTDDPKITWVPVTKVTPGMLYRITVRDGDAISPAGEPLRQPLKITAGTGAAIELNLGGVLDGLDKVATFSGEFYVRLGDAKSPATTLLSRAGQVGKDDLSAEQLRAAGLTSVPTINVQGTDTVTLLYIEPLTADKRTDVPLKLVLKVAADGFVQLFNLQGNPLVDLKPGVPFVIQVTDPTADQTDKNDTVYVAVVSAAGDKLEKVVLSETGPHTGVFLGTIKTVYEKTAADTDKLKVEFGSDISVSYQDIYAISGKTEERKIKLTVDDLAEARAQLLTKVFESQSFEVESTMRLAESLYNLGAVQLTSVKAVEGQKLTNESLKAANVLLTRIIDRFPGSVYEQEALYRSGKISKAEQNYPEAIKLFTNIIEKYSASKFVPKALYELVGIYTSKDVNKIDDAVETTRQLAHGFPNDPMVSEAFIQVAEYYYLVSKDYTMSARIYERLIRRFPDAPKANQMYFRLGSCYWNLGNKEKGVTTDSYVKGGDRYLSYVKLFPDTKQVPDALYWGARCYAAAVKNDNAFTMLQRLVVNYPNSNLAKLAKDMLLTLGNAKPVIDLFD